ncbi:unnamed protein product [Paramecium octaurelia]|uniref:Uncharacterized protein n=1 Tax=Paramecium octaurelia TaxID=43137 RepID=A0A8S1VD23_PAROT|nr:unnamed protein product [Paramecium octaurelia]
MQLYNCDNTIQKQLYKGHQILTSFKINQTFLELETPQIGQNSKSITTE